MVERRQPLVRIARALGTLLTALAIPAGAGAQVPDTPEGTVRIATFNAAMARKGAGVLIDDIAKGDAEVLAVAEIILSVRPDILLINEIDHDPEGIALARFVGLLAEGVGGQPGLSYPHTFTAPVNTGVPSGFDLDRDGRTMGPGDALGFGRFPGQYGMAVLSRVPLASARTFRTLRWADVPWAVAPRTGDGPWYEPGAWASLPLSSKSHWDLQAALPDGRMVHLLASHPTPPVFDGDEDRNGLRNAAEIRFWIDYIEGRGWMTDDAGHAGALQRGAAFVVLGDLNADPERGDGDRATVRALLAHPRVIDPLPASPGGAAAGRATDTADWPEHDGPGNLRVDYVLPSSELRVSGAGVFWPAPGDPLARLVGRRGREEASSDHRLVWVDIALEE